MSIQNHLPVKSKHLKTEKIRVIAGRIPSSIATSVHKILKEDGHSWSDFMTAAMTGFLEERGVKVK